MKLETRPASKTEVPQNLEEFLEKYGTRTLGLLVSKFIEKAPSFEGDLELAAQLGVATMDLQIALEEFQRRTA